MMTLAAWASLAGLAHASDCAFTPAPATRLQSMAAVGDYRPVLKACVATDGRKAIAIREMTVAGQKIALLADPEALTTRLERAACWTCRDASEEELHLTRMGRAIRESAEAPGLVHRGFLQNAGLTHGAGPGRFRHRRPLPKHAAPRSRLLHSARGGEPARSGGALDFGPLADPSFRRFPLARRSAKFRRARHTLGRSHLPPSLSSQAAGRCKLPVVEGRRPAGGNFRHRAASDRQWRDPVAVLPLPRSRLQRSADAGGEPVPSGHAWRRRLARAGAEARTRLDRASPSERQRTSRAWRSSPPTLRMAQSPRHSSP